MKNPNEENCSIFFRHLPTVSQIAKTFKVSEAGVSSVMKLTNDFADHYIEKFNDASISKEGLSKALAIRMFEHGIHYTVIKFEKLKSNPDSQYYYKKKLPYYSLLTSDIKAKAEGRKQRF